MDTCIVTALLWGICELVIALGWWIGDWHFVDFCLLARFVLLLSVHLGHTRTCSYLRAFVHLANF